MAIESRRPRVVPEDASSVIEKGGLQYLVCKDEYHFYKSNLASSSDSQAAGHGASGIQLRHHRRLPKDLPILAHVYLLGRVTT